ncbi:MAG: bifunctional enoyl-CoA hydratase/phosphate acetyltransferase [Bacillota bacterium]
MVSRITSIKDLIDQAKTTKPLKLAVAAAGDSVVLEGVARAAEDGIVEPILIGQEDKIKAARAELEQDFSAEVVATSSDKESAETAMQMIAAGEADFPMKGLLSTKVILQALLNKEYGLRQEGLLSLISLIYLDKEDRVVLMTDGGMNIAPDLEDKVSIINNAVTIARSIGIEKPKVAPLAAVEKVNPKMPATIDAAMLSKMADRGQIGHCQIDGPLALDNAISLDAAEHKGIGGEVAGKADILLVPDIEAGNVLYKAWIFYAGLDSASLVFGAKVPLVLTSRADSSETKYNSIALGKVVTAGLAEL